MTKNRKLIISIAAILLLATSSAFLAFAFSQNGTGYQAGRHFEFTAVIEEIYPRHIIVRMDELLFGSFTRASVATEMANVSDVAGNGIFAIELEIGDRVEIIFQGTISETSPIGIQDVISIRVIN